MSGADYDDKQIGDILVHQLKSYWIDVDERLIRKILPEAMAQIEKGFYGSTSKRFYDGEKVVFSPYMSIHWMIFLYRLSHQIFSWGGVTADQIYYLNKIMHSVDWFYAVDLPIHFFAEHPLGSVLGRAKYGDYLLVYQGTTVGGSCKDDKIYYPIIGNNVILFSNASVLGKSKIGSNVIISAGTRIINEDVPDNCIVFGQTPNLMVKERSKPVMEKIIDSYWR